MVRRLLIALAGVPVAALVTVSLYVLGASSDAAFNAGAVTLALFTIPLGMALGLLFAHWVGHGLSHRRIARGTCPRCSHQLLRRQPRCPECGTGTADIDWWKKGEATP